MYFQMASRRLYTRQLHVLLGYLVTSSGLLCCACAPPTSTGKRVYLSTAGKFEVSPPLETGDIQASADEITLNKSEGPDGYLGSMQVPQKRHFYWSRVHSVNGMHQTPGWDFASLLYPNSIYLTRWYQYPRQRTSNTRTQQRTSHKRGFWN